MPDFRFSQEYVQLDLFNDFGSLDRREIVATYVTELTRNKALVLFDVSHFSRLVGFSEGLLHAISAAPFYFYRRFDVPKKSGGLRTICEPFPTLKLIQRFIAEQVIANSEPHKAARAFRQNHSLRGAAVIHKARPYMLTLDIRDFFPTISGFSVYRVFFDLGYTAQIARLLSGLCTLENGLPQGAPTSPALSNLVLRRFDEVIFNECKSRGVFYTRYADDMTFSSREDNLADLIGVVRKELRTDGLKLNSKKTVMAGKGARKYVNGVVVNERPNILREKRRNLRKDLYYIKKYGINGHVRFSNIDIPNYLDHLIGKLTYAHFITKDQKYKEDAAYLYELKKLT
ncbi:RNA-directed DNA polymerase [Agrobacterium sp. a22-2]|uniref:reverse transcriptase domain-containing protein n=1 Tax=Agrobacterium sp. a22-2 TaxID=2283840 RepID=UPI001445324D|nr:reverse transcriptase domain-containing protein [Agrobacterium sp. a22-2]NKN39824.1 RNA-directed DNA polymerase [Agrobacterium sp. a22-2]